MQLIGSLGLMDHETGVGVGADKQDSAQSGGKDGCKLSLQGVVSSGFLHMNPSRDIFADNLQMYCSVNLRRKKGALHETTEFILKCMYITRSSAKYTS